MELTEQEAQGLESLKAKMSKTQRQEMAEIIQKEMERRGMVEPSMSKKSPGSNKSTVQSAQISGGLSTDQMKELYQDVGQAVQHLRVKKLEEKVGQARRATGAAAKARPMREPRMEQMPPAEYRPRASGMKMMMMYGVVALGILKVCSATGLFDSTVATARPTAELEQHAPIIQASASIPAMQDSISIPQQSGRLWSSAEKEVLMQLDARRVELEQRREALDRRELELKNQAQTLTERLAELRGLTSKLQELRRERETKQEGRLAQLANVYGAMDPNEASILISRLEDNIALELLERMPEKKMGQVLAVMEKARAIDLTKLLSEKRVLN